MPAAIWRKEECGKVTTSVRIDVSYVKQRMEQLGLSKAVLASQVDVDVRTIRNALKGTTSPETLEAIYRLLGNPRVPIIRDGEEIGLFRKLYLHDYNLPHRSCLLLLRESDAYCRIIKRHPEHPHQPNKLDVLGEHESEGDTCGFPETVLKRLMLREMGDRQLVGFERCTLLASALRPYDRSGATMQAGNILETSELFGLDLSSCPHFDASFREDSDDSRSFRLETMVVSIAVLLRSYESNDGSFADGLGKVLREVAEMTTDGRRISKFIATGKPC
jgi:transcriptional regulator with XRE-family HTH domain